MEPAEQISISFKGVGLWRARAVTIYDDLVASLAKRKWIYYSAGMEFEALDK